MITRRLLAAGGEIAHANEFEYVIINQSFADASQQLQSIVEAARLRFSAQAVRHRALFGQLGIHTD